VRYKGANSFKASDLRSIPITTKNNTVIDLGNIANITYGTSPVMLRRVDKRESINISANFDNDSLQNLLKTISTKIPADSLGEGVTYRFIGQADNMKTTFTEMGQAIGLSLILVYILLAVLYESLSTPIIRMFSLPFGFNWLFPLPGFHQEHHQPLFLVGLTGHGWSGSQERYLAFGLCTDFDSPWRRPRGSHCRISQSKIAPNFHDNDYHDYGHAAYGLSLNAR
jgi:hypothetical protein